MSSAAPKPMPATHDEQAVTLVPCVGIGVPHPVITSRPLPANVAAAFDAWSAQTRTQREAVVDMVEFSPQALADELCAPWRSEQEADPSGIATAQVAADLATIVPAVAAASGAARLEVSLGITDGDECTRFHVDYLRLRVVVTYVGPGTEVLPADAVDRSKLGTDDFAQTCKDPSRIQRANPGDIVWLQGVHDASQGTVHRSPRISDVGGSRVVLKVSDLATH